MYLSGYFEIPLTDSLGYGYGYYKANVLSFFNPAVTMDTNFSWSNFLPSIPIVKGEHEGFSYLGLGGIIFLILLFFFFIFVFTCLCSTTFFFKLHIKNYYHHHYKEMNQCG